MPKEKNPKFLQKKVPYLAETTTHTMLEFLGLRMFYFTELMAFVFGFIVAKRTHCWGLQSRVDIQPVVREDDTIELVIDASLSIPYTGEFSESARELVIVECKHCRTTSFVKPVHNCQPIAARNRSPRRG